MGLSPGSKTHLGALWAERKMDSEWWSRLWSDSLALRPLHITLLIRMASAALRVPWIKPELYLVSWEPGQSMLH